LALQFISSHGIDRIGAFRSATSEASTVHVGVLFQ